MKNLIRYILASLIFTCIISCETILEPLDENRLDFEFVNQDPAAAEGLLLQGYSRLVNQNSFSEAATDDAVSNLLNNGFKRMALGELTAQFNPSARWNGNFENVFFINRFLQVLDAGEILWNQDEEINQMFNLRMRGEALALRALHHYYVLQAHAGLGQSGQLLGIPYFKEYIDKDGNFNVPRLSFQESIEAIMTDLNDAVALLPTDYSGNPVSSDPFVDELADIYKNVDSSKYQVVNGGQYDLRMSGRIARALRARVALFAASPAFLDSQEYYTMAAEFSSEVLNTINGVSGLVQAGLEFYTTDNSAKSGESIFRGSIGNPSAGLEQRMFPPSVNGRGEINPTQNFVDAFPMQDGIPISESNDYDPQNPYSNRDPRLEKFVVFNGSSFGGGTINTGFGGKIDRLDSIPQFSTTTGYYLKKLLRPDVVINDNGSTVNQRHYDVYFRYTELFLIFAEAANEIDGPDNQINGISARDVIAAIRQRAGITQPDNYLSSITTKNDMRELIRNERRLELSFEGHRFWDLRRWNLSLNETARGYFFDGNSYIDIPSVEVRNYQPFATYLPIPNNEVFKFSELEQNSGW